MSPTGKEPTANFPVAGLPEISRTKLWTGLLGGGVAWTIHFLLAYVIAEFGCLSGWGKTQFLGVTVLAWLLLGISFLAILAASGATLLAWRSSQNLRRGSVAAKAASGSVEEYMARAGRWTSGLFVFIIMVETVPIFFYLQRC